MLNVPRHSMVLTEMLIGYPLGQSNPRNRGRNTSIETNQRSRDIGC